VEPDSTFPPTDVKELNEKLKDAERLLFYAAEAGIRIEADVRDVVLKARIASAGEWSEQTAADLLSALTTLAAKLKPVTAESLKECADGPTAFIRWYKKWTIVLALCIVPFSPVTFIRPQSPRRFVRTLKPGIDWPSNWAMKLDLLRRKLCRFYDFAPRRRLPIRDNDLSIRIVVNVIFLCPCVTTARPRKREIKVVRAMMLSTMTWPIEPTGDRAMPVPR
jgi:hypothetical protein